MNWLRKLPNSMRSSSGLEWVLWRKLPWIAIGGTAAPLLGLLAVHVLVDTPTGADWSRRLQMADYFVVALVVFHLSMVVTAAIGCAIVMVMKGPAYAADSYYVPHRDAPRDQPQTHEESASFRNAGDGPSPP